ncbi:MAG: 3-dehydroquinate synthase, partial [Clostridia bacterium]|nr:3-dehydroquinate synthase [Clostridia bacterium]
DFVEQDEFDRGLRMMLNFGHTFGHAVESCSQFSIAHGQAVAMGMAAITKSAVKRGFCEEDTLQKLTALLKSYRLDAKIPYPAQELFLAAGSDKKSSGGSINLIVPQKIGCCTIEKIQKSELLDWLKDGGIQ